MDRHFEKNRFSDSSNDFLPLLLKVSSDVSVANMIVVDTSDEESRNRTVQSLWNLIALCEAAIATFGEDVARESKVVAEYELDPDTDIVENILFSGGVSNE